MNLLFVLSGLYLDILKYWENVAILGEIFSTQEINSQLNEHWRVVDIYDYYACEITVRREFTAKISFPQRFEIYQTLAESIPWPIVYSLVVYRGLVRASPSLASRIAKCKVCLLSIEYQYGGGGHTHPLHHRGHVAFKTRDCWCEFEITGRPVLLSPLLFSTPSWNSSFTRSSLHRVRQRVFHCRFNNNS